MRIDKVWLSFFIFFFLSVSSVQSIEALDSFQVQFSDYTVSSIPYDIEVYTTNAEWSGFIHFIINNRTDSVFLSQGKGIYTVKKPSDEPVHLTIANQDFHFSPSPVPIGWSILPPLLAIFLALIFKEVVTSLFAGILAGAIILHTYGVGLKGILFGLMASIDDYVVNSLTDPGHISIILFSFLIGGMVAIISKNGGMQGIVNQISGFAKDARSGQLATWLLGIVIFFDDYANTLVVGNTMRPVTDRLKISREKLAYIVDSTAAPIAAIAFVTTWIGAELGYIESGIKNLETLNEAVYETFILSLQYSFYPIFTLIFILFLITQNKDFGPMHLAEKRARETGKVSSMRTDLQVSQNDLSEFTTKAGINARSHNALIPILVIIMGTIAGLFYTGWDQEIWKDPSLGLGIKLSSTIGEADSFLALLWSSLIGVIIAALLSISQKIMKIEEVISSLLSGFNTMLPAILILTLAWSLAAVTEDMHTAEFLTSLMSDNIRPQWMPAITFVLAVLVSFSTGTSWGTMAILYPLVLPTSWIMTESFGMDYAVALSIFHNVVASVLAGSVMGDHCSPISDTTILSSLASSCHHIDHVRTQMPYALVVGAVALIAGVIPAAWGISSWILFPSGIIILYFIVKYTGRSLPCSPLEGDQI